MHYEIMCVADHRAPLSRLVGYLRSVNNLVTKTGGVVRSVEHLGTRPLAYRMKAHKRFFLRGRYVRVRYDSSPRVMAAVRKSLKTNEDVVRFLVVRRAAAPTRPGKAPKKEAVLPSERSRYDTAALEYLRQNRFYDWQVLQLLIRNGKLSEEEIRLCVAKIARPPDALDAEPPAAAPPRAPSPAGAP